MNKQISKSKDAKEMEIPFTMIPNFCLDTMAMRKPAENCVYFAIIRQTAGYMTEQGGRKKNALLSISRLVQLTGLSRQGVLNSRRNLFNDGWIMYKLFGGMSSYAIIDRHEEFKRKQESTELTDASQHSLLDQSTELTDASQMSRHIKESEIKSLNKNKESNSFPSQDKVTLFFEHHKKQLMQTRKHGDPDLHLVDKLGTLIDWSIETYDKILKAKQNSTWEVRRNQPNTAKWLLATMENENLESVKSNVVTFPKYDLEELRKEGFV